MNNSFDSDNQQKSRKKKKPQNQNKQDASTVKFNKLLDEVAQFPELK